MFNIIHMATSPGMCDTTRRPRPVAQPAGVSHFTLIQGGRAEAPLTDTRRSRDVVSPTSHSSPSSG